MKMIINGCYGGFSFSEELSDFLGINQDDTHIMFDENDDLRTNPLAIEFIEREGSERASGENAHLYIAEFPDEVQYYIDDYDGLETIVWDPQKENMRHTIQEMRTQLRKFYEQMPNEDVYEILNNIDENGVIKKYKEPEDEKREIYERLVNSFEKDTYLMTQFIKAKKNGLKFIAIIKESAYKKYKDAYNHEDIHYKFNMDYIKEKDIESVSSAIDNLLFHHHCYVHREDKTFALVIND